MKKRIDLYEDSLSDSLKVVDDFCSIEFDFDGEFCFKVKLVYEEIITNMFKHAKNNGTSYVDLNISTNGSGVFFVFRYNGDEFDPTTYKDKRVNEPFSTNKEQGGLGLFLVSQFAKKFVYKREDNINELSLEI